MTDKGDHARLGLFYLMKINTCTNKNQVQSRKFNIAHLTRNVSTPVFRGVYGNSVRTYLEESSNSSIKESA